MSERGRRFQRGNKFGKGRPKGSPNKQSVELEKLLLAHSEEIIGDVIRDAKKGDRTALTLCIERLIPRLKDAMELPVEDPGKGPIVVEFEFV